MTPNQERLEYILKTAAMNWSDDFVWEITPYDPDEPDMFEVSGGHKLMPYADVSFLAKVEDGKVQMEMAEDSWDALTGENLFTFMFFDVAQKYQVATEKQHLLDAANAWNQENPPGTPVVYNDLDNLIQATTTSPAYVKGSFAYVEITGIGRVSLFRIKPVGEWSTDCPAVAGRYAFCADPKHAADPLNLLVYVGEVMPNPHRACQDLIFKTGRESDFVYNLPGKWMLLPPSEATA